MRAPSAGVVTYRKAYYAGGARVVIDGVPIRLVRAPSAANLADLRAHEKWRVKSIWDSPREKAEQRVKDAKRAIECYAAALGISYKAARARIERQRLHLLANPLIDLTLEYDL